MAKPIPKKLVKYILERDNGICQHCGRPGYKEQLCENHYYQMQRYGKIYKEDRYKPNPIEIKGDHAEMTLFDKHGEVKGIALIDIRDIEKVKKYKWHISGTGYVSHKSTKTSLLLHRYITDCPKGKVIDHANHNRLDNRRSNLRICTQKQNARNQSIRTDNSSGYKGVRWHPQWGWQAYIADKGKQVHVGWYKTKEEAIKARMRRANEFYGGFANEIP